MVHLRMKEYVLIATVLTTYALMEARWAFTGIFCPKTNFDNFFETYYENDVILEFAKFGFECLQNSSSSSKCGKDAMNSTRTIVNGKVWDGNEKDDRFILTVEEDQDRSKNEKMAGNAEKFISNSVVTNIFEAERRPLFKLFSCEKVGDLFQEVTLKRDFTLVKKKPTGFGRDMKEGITVYEGKINHPVLGRIACYLKEAKLKTDDGKPYYALMNEREKYLHMNTDSKITSRLLGECVSDGSVRIIVEAIQDPSICEDEENIDIFSSTECFQNVKLKKMIDSQKDKTRAAFSFIRELLCLYSEIEKKHFFIQDIHGKHISVTSNFSRVYVNNIDNLSYHGSRNILSGSICKYDENCPAPSGDLWNNGSANRIIYEKCKDPEPVCTDTSCVGFNSSIHVCGITRWILQPLYPYFHRLQDRSRMTHIMMSSMNSWSFLRRPASDSCEKATLYLSMYDKDMAALAPAQKQPPGKSFHVGKAPPKPANNFHVG